MSKIKEIQYPVGFNIESDRLFSEEYEDNECILFHGTSGNNLESICREGLKPKPNGGLESVSYAKRSVGAIQYAAYEENPIIIVFELNTLQQNGIKNEPDVVYIYPNPETGYRIKPKIVGYMKLAESLTSQHF